MLTCSAPSATAPPKKLTESKIRAIIKPITSREANIEGVRPVSSFLSDVAVVINKPPVYP